MSYLRVLTGRELPVTIEMLKGSKINNNTEKVATISSDENYVYIDVSDWDIKLSSKEHYCVFNKDYHMAVLLEYIRILEINGYKIQFGEIFIEVN